MYFTSAWYIDHVVDPKNFVKRQKSSDMATAESPGKQFMEDRKLIGVADVLQR